MIKCVVFDFDGVLVDSNSVKRNAYFDIFATVGNAKALIAQCLAEEREGDRYHVIERILSRLSEAGLMVMEEPLLESVGLYAEQYNEICEAATISCSEIHGASDCLRSLKSDFALYVNSATPEIPLRRVIAQRGWSKYFKNVFGSPVLKLDNLHKIGQTENVDKAEMLFVGDSQRDFSAAQAFGCHFCGIHNSDNDFNTHPRIIMDDLAGLEKIVRKL